MNEIGNLKQTIFAYRRTREVYAKYRDSGWSPNFFAAHAKEIQQYRNAKRQLEAVPGKLPTVKELSAEYDKLLEEKQKAVRAHREKKNQERELLIAKANVDCITNRMPNQESYRHENEQLR